jgi:hypothetical protein
MGLGGQVKAGFYRKPAPFARPLRAGFGPPPAVCAQFLATTRRCAAPRRAVLRQGRAPSLRWGRAQRARRSSNKMPRLATGIDQQRQIASRAVSVTTSIATVCENSLEPISSVAASHSLTLQISGGGGPRRESRGLFVTRTCRLRQGQQPGTDSREPRFASRASERLY